MTASIDLLITTWWLFVVVYANIKAFLLFIVYSSAWIIIAGEKQKKKTKNF